MSKKNLMIFASVSLLLLAGCGRHYNGVYRGKESMTRPGYNPEIKDLTMSLNQNGDSVNGTWQSTLGDSGTITGTSTGDGLTNVTLTTTTPLYNQSLGFYPTAGCQQTYIGTLNSPNSNQLTGILISNGAACGGFANQGNTSRAIDVSK